MIILKSTNHQRFKCCILFILRVLTTCFDILIFCLGYIHRGDLKKEKRNGSIVDDMENFDPQFLFSFDFLKFLI